jgi:hypothetical protein
VSRSGYYEWLRRPEKVKVDVLSQKVKRIFIDSRKTYGTRRIKRKLAAEGILASRKRIRRIKEYIEMFYRRQILRSANR